MSEDIFVPHPQLDFKICIKNEGLHPNTVMAMQELGVGEQHETSGELTNTVALIIGGVGTATIVLLLTRLNN